MATKKSSKKLSKKSSKKSSGNKLKPNLYNDLHPNQSLKGTGYKNVFVAKKTIDLIKKRSLKYQFNVINTMYNRAKFHPYQTTEMKDAMKVFKKWLDKYSINKKTK